MSIAQPKFGDVFKWDGESGKQWIMYVAPDDLDVRGERPWIGLTLRGEGSFVGTPGECCSRVPLTGRDWTTWVDVNE